MQPPNRFIVRHLLYGVFVFCAWLMAAAPVTAQTTSTNGTSNATIEFSRIYVQVVTGEEHACGLTDAGEIFCWGGNGNDQLGGYPMISSPLPVAVSGLEGKPVALAAGGFQTCALMEDGSATCWPIDWDMVEPTVLPGLEENVTALAGGRWHFCAIVDDEVLCWGSNRQMQLGNGIEEDRDDPTPVDGLAGKPVAITAGDSHACALLEDGGIQCWGGNRDGQLGDGTTTTQPIPVDVTGLGGPAVRIAAGRNHTCALLEEGSVWCWGFNAGFKQSTTDWIRSLAEPVEISGLDDEEITEFVAGAAMTCAVQAEEVVCWAVNNASSQLGDAYDEGEQGPVTIKGFDSPVSNLDVGEGFSCAVLVSGQIQCWGYNQQGQLGIGAPTQRDIPMTVRSVVSPTSIAMGGSFIRGFTCAATDGDLLCWGDGSGISFGADTVRQSGVPVQGARLPSPVVQVAAGVQHACALEQNGGVQCWGSGFSGQLGNGSSEGAATPVQVSGLARGGTQLVGGDYHMCVLTDTGRVLCWGSNRDGQLGIGDAAEAATPETPAGLEEDVAAIYASRSGACALLTDGAASCWGNNWDGQVGDGSMENRFTPTPVSLLDAPATELAMGNSHTCALLEDGTVQCWGDNSVGQLGDGTTTSALTRTVTVQGLPVPITALSAGGSRTCAIVENGGLWCWGGNRRGELGTGTAAISSTVPSPVLGLGADVTSVYLGPMHSCAVLVDGAVRCWGDDGDGQLGIGTTSSVAAPVTVVETALPHAELAAQRAAPGSRITLSGENLASGAPISVLANGDALSPPLTATGRGALLAWLDTADADPGYYELTLVAGDAVTAAGGVSLTLHLLITDTAPLLTPLGGAVPMLALPSGVARDAADAPAELQQRTFITLKSGVNVRTEPNGALLATTTATTDVIYDTGRDLDEPVDVAFTDAEGVEVVLPGVNAAGRVWLPVLWEEEPAWVADVVVSGVAVR